MTEKRHSITWIFRNLQEECDLVQLFWMLRHIYREKRINKIKKDIKDMALLRTFCIRTIKDFKKIKESI